MAPTTKPYLSVFDITNRNSFNRKTVSNVWRSLWRGLLAGNKMSTDAHYLLHSAQGCLSLSSDWGGGGGTVEGEGRLNLGTGMGSIF
jgi:hypothetical protein